MTWTSDLALSALWFGAGAAAAWRFTMLHYQSRLSAAKQSANLFAAWWERDSAKMLIAQAQLDLIHQQHVDAGKKAHEPWKALPIETTRPALQNRRRAFLPGVSGPRQRAKRDRNPDRMDRTRARASSPTQRRGQAPGMSPVRPAEATVPDISLPLKPP